jgi:adenine-specific DNA-methyltransferase
MKNRLEVARDLLSEDGVIFVQCDDNEQAYLKVLMDEVFERDNFVANFIWKKKGTSTNVKGVQVSQLCELIVCYTATKATAIYSRIIKSENRTYSHKDELGKYRLVIIEKKNTGEYRRESMRFKIIGKEPRTGKRWQIGEIKAKKLWIILWKSFSGLGLLNFPPKESFVISLSPSLVLPILSSKVAIHWH